MAGNTDNNSKKFQKSYFDVLGLCCPSEVPLIEKILKQLDGIQDVSVIVPTRTVIVIHDNLLVTQIQIVKALNQARLEANVRVYGQEKKGRKWPSLYTMACGLLLLISFFRHFFNPLKWLALAAVIIGLPPMLLRCIAAIRNVTLDINILMLIAVGGTVATRDYWEAATIVFLFTISEWLESRASHKATSVMSSLMSMAPQKAILAENGLEVDAKDIKLNTILAVKAGEVIPIDGIVVEGRCEVDEKSLTGEPFPVTKQDQSKVLAGTINLNGYISVKTTALAEDCAVAKMAKLVEEAQNNKSQTQRFIDRVAKYYTPAIVVISIGVAAIPAVMRVHNINHWIHLALVILVSACPCALILSTPVATFCALTKAATTGLLIKGGDYLETLAKIKITAFDKTGTITRGEFSVTDFRSIRNDISLNTLLYWVSSIESKSSHPMAATLVDYGISYSVEPKPENVKEFQNFPGEGICGEIDGKHIYIGNKRIAMRAGCKIVPDVGGETVGYIFLGGDQIGTFSLADTCRTGVSEAINQLKSLGIKTAMLTGDNHAAAMRVQEQLEHAIDVVHADLLPEEKVKIIKELKKEGPTAMIGDGINDAPALATADIGISMGISGSALATETGHITLMSNDIRKIPKAIRLARKTHRTIIENVAISILTKAAIIALAIAGHPLLWAAVLSDVGTCLLVIFNSMLILRGTPTPRGNSHKSKCVSQANGSGMHGGCGTLSPEKHGCCSQDDKPRTSEANGDHSHGGCSSLSPVKKKCCSNDDKQRTSEARHETATGGVSHGGCSSLSPVKKKCCSNDDKPRTSEAPHETTIGDISHGGCSSLSPVKKKCCSHDDKPRTSEAQHEITIGDVSYGGCSSLSPVKKKCCSHDDKPRTSEAQHEITIGDVSYGGCSSLSPVKKKCCSHDDKPRTSDARHEITIEEVSHGGCSSLSPVEKKCCSRDDKPRTSEARPKTAIGVVSHGGCSSLSPVKKKCCSGDDMPKTSEARHETAIADISHGGCSDLSLAKKKCCSPATGDGLLIGVVSHDGCSSLSSAKKKCCSRDDKPRTSEARHETAIADVSHGGCSNLSLAKKKCCSPATGDGLHGGCSNLSLAKKKCCSPATGDGLHGGCGNLSPVKQKCSHEPITGDDSRGGCSSLSPVKPKCCSHGDTGRTDEAKKQEKCASHVIQIISNGTSSEVEKCEYDSNAATETKCSEQVVKCENSHAKCNNRTTRNADLNFGDMSTEEIVVAPMHWCSSLERREMDGCCKSFRRECGGTHGCIGGGHLSEIITE